MGKKRGTKYKGIMGAVLVILLIVGSFGLAMAADPADAGYSFYSGAAEFEFNLGRSDRHAAGVFVSNRIEFEGGTVNAYETLLIVTEPTSDNAIALPNTSGTIALTNSTITGQGATDGQIMVHNGVSYQDVTPSGFWTITNTGLSSPVANQVDVTALFTNTVSLTIARGALANTVAVEDGSFFTGFEIYYAGSINAAAFTNTIFYNTTTDELTWTLTNTVGPLEPIVWGKFIRP